MNNPLVSILIPVYNTEKYVAEAVESVLNQTYKNIEIIIVDDGSTDRSWEIIENYRQKYPDIIKTYRQENKGACAARNKAFELSIGDYIQYLDSDDYITEKKISEQMKLFRKYGDEIITSCSWTRIENGNVNRKKIDKNYPKPIDWLIDSWTGNGSGQTSIWLTPRPIIEKAGKWNENLRKNQDGEFFSRIIINSKAIMFSEKALVFYRYSPASLSNLNSYSICDSLLSSYELYMKNLKSYLKDKKIRKALGYNFTNFYVMTYPHYPDLLKRAESNIKELGLWCFPAIGNWKFKLIASIIGVKNAKKVIYFTKKSN